MTQAMHMPVHVAPDAVDVVPGKEFVLAVSVFNTASIIDAFEIALVGADQRWVTSEPTEIRLFPDTAESVDLRITVPRDFPAGRHVVTVRVTSQTTGEVVASSGVTLEICELRSATAQLDPQQVVAGKTGRFGVVAGNTGNVAIDLQLSGDDKTNELNYDITPRHLLLEPGQTSLAQIVVTGSRPVTGTPAARPFTITAEAEDVRFDLPANFVSQPWIPRWLLTFLSVAMLMALWAFIVGLAIDAILEDGTADLTAAFTEGMESVVEAIDPDALAESASGQAGTGSAAAAAIGALQGAEGTVVGMAVPGATVIAVPLHEAGTRKGQIDTTRDPVETTVGEDGTFVFEEMIEGDYILVASSPGYETPTLPAAGEVYACPEPGSPEPQCFSVPTTTTDPIVVTLVGEPGLISGLVMLEGEPLKDVLVVVNHLMDPLDGADSTDDDPTQIENSQRVVEVARVDGTESDGLFAFEQLETPASYEIVLSATGFATQRSVVPLAAGQRIVELEFPMTPSGVGTVFGIVRDGATDVPLGGVLIEVTNAEGATSLKSGSLSVVTDGIGRFEVIELPIGRYIATFKLEGYSDTVLPFEVTGATPEELTPVLIPKPGPAGAPIGTVSGVVTDSLTGEGLGGVQVTVSGASGSFVTTTLSAASGSSPVGWYSLAGLPIGSYTASFVVANYMPAGKPADVTVDNASPAVSAALNVIPTPVTGTVFVVNGPVTDPVIEPLPGLEILYDPKPEDPDNAVLTLGVTDAVGGFAVEVPATPGIHSLTLGGEFLVPTIEIAVEPGTAIDASQTTVIRLFDITGNLVDEFGRTLTDSLFDVDPPLVGDIAVRITSFTAANNLFSIDPADPQYQYNIPVGEPLNLTGLPGPALYTFSVTLPVSTPRIVQSITIGPIELLADDDRGNVVFPFSPGVIWGTLTSAGAPLADTAIDLNQVTTTDDGMGNITETVTFLEGSTTDPEGRVLFGPLTTAATLRVTVPGTPVVTCTPDAIFANPGSSFGLGTLVCG